MTNNTFTGKKILVMDDDRGIQEAFRAILESVDYQVITEGDPAELFKVLESSKADLIILDVLLSGADGRDICKKLKADDNTKGIPVIIVSAHPSASKSIRDAGADDFLAKPFQMDELLNKITKLLEKQQTIAL